MNTKNIAIYGGSFNPPTIAHSIIVEQVLTKTKIDKVIISPSWVRADKDFNVKEENRKALIDIFFQSLKDKKLTVEFDKYFLEWKNWWYTTTFQEEAYFREKLWFSPYFIFWSDIIPDMPRWSWNKNKFIERKLKKIFINRVGYSFEAEKYSIENYIFLKNCNIPNISSSLVKQRLKNKQKISDLVDSKIEDYIRKNNLYL